jgi:beta-galactosidase
MKTRLFIFLALVLFGYSLSAQKTRQTLLFNDNWRFYQGDSEAADKPGFNDNDWRKVTLPHDWSIEGPFDNKWASSTAYLPAGIGWYRKTFSLQPGIKGKNIELYFDGVYKNSEVWINGHYLGKRPNGFIAFYYDITPYLNQTGNNTIAVKVDHSEYGDSRWYTGSGIYRNVYLIATNPVHVAVWGVNFETSLVTINSADAKIKVTLSKYPGHPVKALIKSELLAPDGKVTAYAAQTIETDATRDVPAFQSIVINKPSLWSIEHPNLYRLQVSVYVGGKLIDQINKMVGIRSAVFDKDKGFTLNGKSMKLKGVCIHDDAGALGVAVPQQVWERRLKTLQEAGVNSLRLSHNPHADYIYDLCDKLGLLVMDEAFDEWEIGKNKWIAGWNVGKPGNDGYHEYFKDWADRDLTDMILRDRIHPSIFLWSIGNEIDYPNDPYTHEVLNTGNNPQIYGKGYTPDHPTASEMTGIAKHLVSVVKQYDTSRPVTAALAGVVMSNEVGYPDVLDVVGYNYQEFRYEEDHQKYPNRIIYGSENGMDAKAWNAVASKDFIAGQYLWTGIDYLGEAKKWPARSSTPGLLDLAGFKKPEFYFRQSLWIDKPMIYIGANPAANKNKENHNAEPNWNWAAGTQLRISCFTNCDEAELFLNGKPLGKKQEVGKHILNWDITYEPGELSVKGYNKGRPVTTCKLVTAGEPYAIKISEQQPAGKNGLHQVIAEIVDKQGNLVYGADNEVTVSIKGNAELLGLENGDYLSHEAYQSASRKIYHGKLLAYIQPKSNASKFTVTFSSPGLTSQVKAF